jgi:acetyl-CoA acetyltransferase
VVYPYDGFTIISLVWYEALGYCAAGEAADFLRDAWDEGEQRFRINGRVISHPMGGSLSKGGSQGASYIHDAVLQLRGQAENQVPGARAALLAIGGFFQNASATILRS